MQTKFVLVSLVAGVLAFGLACGGGGGSDGSSSSSPIRFSGKTGDGLRVYGLDGTYSEPSPLYFSGNFISSGGDTGELDVPLEKGDYRIRYVDSNVETMEFIVLESDFERADSSGKVDMGEMNGVTTYLSSLFFKDVTVEKSRFKASDVLSALRSFFDENGMESFQNASRGSIETYFRTAEERTWANLTMINLRRISNLLASGGSFSQSQWDALVNAITDMAVEEENGGDPSTQASNYLAQTNGLPELSEEEAEEVIIGLSSSGNQFGLLLQMAQADNATEFASLQTQYIEDEVIEGVYAFVDLSNGDVTYADELTLNEDYKDSVMVFSKIPASSSYTYLVGGEAQEISLSEYYVGIYEVTQDQYGQIVDGEFSGNTPVHSITQDSAMSYASSLGALLSEGQVNLPSDAQWEVAARGAAADSDTTDYLTWNCFDNGGFDAEEIAVGSLNNANVSDLYDMNGNVAEFCRDRLTSVTTATDPVGESSLVSVRGGSWINIKEHCTVAHKEVTSDTATANSATGFRLIFTKN